MRKTQDRPTEKRLRNAALTQLLLQLMLGRLFDVDWIFNRNILNCQRCCFYSELKHVKSFHLFKRLYVYTYKVQTFADVQNLSFAACLVYNSVINNDGHNTAHKIFITKARSVVATLFFNCSLSLRNVYDESHSRKTSDKIVVKTFPLTLSYVDEAA